MPESTASERRADDQPVGLRLRADLIVRSQSLGGRRGWVVKDPVALRHYYLRDEEYALAAMLDGRASLTEIRERFEREHAPRRFSVRRFQAFAARLHQDGLLVAEAAGQGAVLTERAERRKSRERWQALSGILSLRFRGVDPDRFLSALAPWFGWCFHPLTLALCGLLIAFTGWFWLAEWAEIRARLPEAQEFFRWDRWLGIALVLAVIKVLHELGHGVACKHFGGECHELGLMLLIFTPCLYCDVSDSWMVAGRWRRAAIVAAGIFVELMIASVATWVWWWTTDGWLHHASLVVVTVSGVGTLLFNGNPLLRYDGYFVLADVLDRPNLWQQSRTWLQGWLSQLVSGVRSRRDAESLRVDWFTRGYAVTSEAYRWFVIGAVLVTVRQILVGQQMGILAAGVAALTLGGVVMPMGVQAVQRWSDPGFRRDVRRGRVAFAAVAFAALIVAAWLVPLPRRVSAPLVIEPRDAAPLYAVAAGHVRDMVSPRTSCEPGQVVARLVNPDIERDVARLEGELAVSQARVAQLESRRIENYDAGTQLPAARERRKDLTDRLAARRRDAARLDIIAPQAGVFLPAPPSPIRPIRTTSDRLSNWDGSPWEARSRDAYLESGTLIGWIGDGRHWDATLIVSEADLPMLETGQSVEVLIEAWPGRRWSGTVMEIGRRDVEAAPRELAAPGDVAVRRDATGIARPTRISYQARVRLETSDDDATLLVNCMRGEARVTVAPEPLAPRLGRWLASLFVGS